MKQTKEAGIKVMFPSKRKSVLVFALVLVLSFLPSCLGIKGPDVIRGDKMVDIIRKELQSKFVQCKIINGSDVRFPDLGYSLTYNQRVYYRVKDMDLCRNQIRAMDCNVLNQKVLGDLRVFDFVIPLFCEDIEPNAVLDSPYFQGNFL